MFHNAKYSTTLDKIQIAKMLITFFRHGSMLDKDIELLWPSNEVPNVILSAQVIIIIYDKIIILCGFAISAGRYEPTYQSLNRDNLHH